MKINRLTIPSFLAAICFGLSTAIAEDNTKCPIMTDDDADPEYTVEYEGKKVILCCDKCGKIWNGNEKYIIKSVPDLLPQFKGMEEKLGLDKVELLPQKFCPIKKDNLVTPDSPTVEYKGKKVYFFDKKAKETWEKDPEAAAKKAIEAGLLPQFSEKADAKPAEKKEEKKQEKEN